MSPYLSSTKVLGIQDKDLNQDLSNDQLNNSLTKCSSFVSTASYSTSTISDDDSDSPRQMYKNPPGLRKSVIEKLANNNSSNAIENKELLFVNNNCDSSRQSTSSSSSFIK